MSAVMVWLESLRDKWHIELATTPDGWRLLMNPRAGGFYAQTYVGPALPELVRRAHAGEAPDFRSR